jgi:predicted nucleotidyltransferase
VQEKLIRVDDQSLVRGEQEPDSEIDILIELERLPMSNEFLDYVEDIADAMEKAEILLQELT